jgi:hypothetical protein
MVAKQALVMVAIVGTVSLGVQAGWQDSLKGLLGDQKSVPSFSGGQALSALSQSDLVGGLKEALGKGVDLAVDQLGKPNGFLASDLVRIPVPDKLQSIESALRAAGQGEYVDSFIETLNRAAEAAVPETLDILKSSVKDMSIEDAQGILSGPDDAATQYLRRIGGERIRAKVAPIVQRATNESGVTQSYKSLTGTLGFMQQFLKPKDYDLDSYVTDQTMDGLFTMIAAEEKRIRENPVARTTDLLKKVFSK